MVTVTLKDGVKKEFEKGTPIIDIAKSISEGLARNACAGIVNGETKDLRFPIEEDCELSIATFDDKEGQAAQIANLALDLFQNNALTQYDFQDQRYIFLPYQKVDASNVADYQKQ